MTAQRRAHPGGYIKEKLVKGVCYCCLVNPIKTGNKRLCGPCYRDPHNYEDRVDPHQITEDDSEALQVKVDLMELTPPTPVKRWRSGDFSQEQLQQVLDGGTP